MLLFVVLAWQIEEKYGAFRLAFIFFWSAIGGQPSCHPDLCMVFQMATFALSSGGRVGAVWSVPWLDV